MLQTVFRLGERDVAEVVDVLCEAFADYPVMHFVLGADVADYERRLEALIHFFVEARVLRGEVILGIGQQDRFDGAALVSGPSGPPSPPELSELREGFWADLGSPARARYDSFAAACARFEVETQHIQVVISIAGIHSATSMSS